MQQDLFNWFDCEKDPLVQHGRPLLILIGRHGRLSNIDDQGMFLRDDAFEVNGVPVFHKGGSSARGLLSGWVKLRRECPEARKMLETVSIFQQPSGFQDAILSTWRIQELSA